MLLRRPVTHNGEEDARVTDSLRSHTQHYHPALEANELRLDAHERVAPATK